MLVSTKGRYALRVMLDLAERDASLFIPLKDIALRQGISKKYLENIMATLSKAGFIDAQQGKGGGYRLNRHPSGVTVGSILKLTEGSIAPISCLENNQKPCERSAGCKTLPMWAELHKIIDSYLEQVTLADLLHNSAAGDYVL